MLRKLLMALAGLCVAMAPAAAAPAPAELQTTPVIAPPPLSRPSAPSSRVVPTPAAVAGLARLYSAPDLTIPAEVRIFREKFPGMVRQISDFDELVKVAPNFAEELTKAVEPSMVRYVQRSSDEFQRQSGAVIQANMSAGEVADLTAFYKSGPGQRMLASMVDNSDPDALIDKALKGEDFTTGDATRQTANAARKVGRTMSVGDRSAMLKFMIQPGYRALARVSPQLNKLKVDLLNAPDPVFEAEMVEAMTELMKRYEGAPATK